MWRPIANARSGSILSELERERGRACVSFRRHEGDQNNNLRCRKARILERQRALEKRIMSRKKASHMFWFKPGKASHYMCIATSAKFDLVWHINPSSLKNHNSKSSVRDNLPGRVLSIHLKTPYKIHSLPPILYTAKNAKM